MILERVRIENFRCVEDSREFSVAPVTCLVGKNESGKSALLQALYKLNPVVAADGHFDPVQDYPRRHLLNYEERRRRGAAPENVLSSTWRLDHEDHLVLAGALGSPFPDAPVVITKGYDNRLRSELRWPTRADGEGTGPGLTRCDDGFRAIATDVLLGRVPRFLYFAETDRLPGQVAIDEFLARSEGNRLGFADRLFQALLALANVTPTEIQVISRFEPFIAHLEAVAQRISQRIFAYWGQNTHLQAEFRVDRARPGDPPPFDRGDVFRTRIKNTRHGVSVSFDDRSTGFAWFFSFLVWFAQIRATYGENLIILLDEPALSLHARAQRDLLRYVNETLKPRHQVVYTTHSPFMIDAENLGGVRTVEDVVTPYGTVEGTRVGDEVLSTDEETLAPLQAALGYDVIQSLFVGRHTLLVEDPADLLYVRWFSRELSLRGRQPLDRRWEIAPCGGIDRLACFVSLLRGEPPGVAVVTDCHDGTRSRVTRLRESHVLRQDRVFSADTYAEQREADVEDLFGRPMYVALVNSCYDLDATRRLPETRPNKAPARVIKEVEAHFASLPSAEWRFDAYRVAQHLTEQALELRATLPGLDHALARFERLFRDLNGLLRWESGEVRTLTSGVSA